MKYEWKKNEKALYIPTAKPQLVDVPRMKFFTLSGTGNPNDEFFADYIGVLYSLSYAVRMSPKSGTAPAGYYEYTVYPLEGVWDLTDEGRYDIGTSGELDKDELVFNLMIRQPDFVTADYAEKVVERTKNKKPHRLLERIRFESIEEGRCVQMLHAGAYDDEPASFRLMDAFCTENGIHRKEKTHREIYLSDPRKTEAAKLRTVLRFRAE